MKILIFPFLLFLSACAEYTAGKGAVFSMVDGVKTEAVKTTEELQNRLLDDSEFMVCDGVSVMVARERYGGSQEEANRWNAFCQGDRNINIIMP